MARPADEGAGHSLESLAYTSVVHTLYLIPMVFTCQNPADV
jgi:hypothetical protein